MRSVADMLGSLWAAVWVRWELMRARRSRRAAGRDRRDDVVLPIMAVPVEGVDYDPAELEPELLRRLETTAAELLAAAPAEAPSPSRRRQRPLRTVATVAAALLTVAVVGASASALIAGTTGVPAMDRLLGIWESGLDRDTVPERPGSTPGDVRPERAGPTLRYGVPDGPSGEVTSFVGATRQVCMVSSRDSGRTGVAVCDSVAALADDLRDAGLHTVQLDVGDGGVTIFGEVAGDVDELRAKGPAGPMEVVLGERWAADLVPGGVRPFVASAKLTGPAAEDVGTRATRWALYSFEIERDGRTTTVSPEQRLE